MKTISGTKSLGKKNQTLYADSSSMQSAFRSLGSISRIGVTRYRTQACLGDQKLLKCFLGGSGIFKVLLVDQPQWPVCSSIINIESLCVPFSAWWGLKCLHWDAFHLQQIFLECSFPTNLGPRSCSWFKSGSHQAQLYIARTGLSLYRASGISRSTNPISSAFSL